MYHHKNARSGDAQSSPRRSLPISGIFPTRESVPGSLASFEPFEVQPSKVTFKWELPRLEANGIITGFVIQYGLAAAERQPFIAEANRVCKEERI